MFKKMHTSHDIIYIDKMIIIRVSMNLIRRLNYAYRNSKQKTAAGNDQG